MIKILFWGSLCFIAYTYVGYPLVLLLWSKIRHRTVDKSYIEPTVSIIIAAYNEERFIGPKIENCLNLSYAKDKLKIIVVSDGSDDDTNEIVRQFQSEAVEFYSYEERKGKAHALNLGIAKAKSEVIFFTDARQILQRDCLKELVSNFHDPSVAVVSGELVLLSEEENEASEGIGLYWKIEKWMRRKESQIHSVLGATGSIYACRRNLVKPLPVQTVLDDVLIPFGAILRGYRSVFEPKAKAFDLVHNDLKREFKRKVRTLSGNYQILCLNPSLLHPYRNPVLIQFISHKIARLFIPFAMILLLVSNFLLTSPFYLIFLFFQIGFYLLALFPKWSHDNCLGNFMKSLNVILVLNTAALVSFFRFIYRRQEIRWEKTN
jgi:poly-beta-1,6-N-acetyl-D-glucosamine synthase